MAEIRSNMRQFQVTALLGPRQCGKTTLARSMHVQPSNYFDVEDPVDVARLESPRTVLSKLKGPVVIDEIQRMPELFPILRVLADRPGRPANFLILGSATPDLVRGASESLAGRIGFIDLTGFDLEEAGPENLDRLWLRGGFPGSFLARDEDASFRWRANFFRTFLTQDLPSFGIRVASEKLRKFWLTLTHYHGQNWNANEIAGALGLDNKSCQYYLDILRHTFMIRTLQPWSENLGKRERRAPKVYMRDSGLYHTLMNLHTMRDIERHPKIGASWEGFVIEQIISTFRLLSDECYYWAVHSGAELDFLAFRDGKRLGFEVKFMDAPRLTRSMSTSMETLNLDRLYVVYPGDTRYELDSGIEALPLADVPTLRAKQKRRTAK